MSRVACSDQIISLEIDFTVVNCFLIFSYFSPFIFCGGEGRQATFGLGWEMTLNAPDSQCMSCFGGPYWRVEIEAFADGPQPWFADWVKPYKLMNVCSHA